MQSKNAPKRAVNFVGKSTAPLGTIHHNMMNRDVDYVILCRGIWQVLFQVFCFCHNFCNNLSGEILNLDCRVKQSTTS